MRCYIGLSYSRAGVVGDCPCGSAVYVSDQPRYQTLRDYLRVIRAQRWLVLLCVVLFGGLALLYSLRQEPVYQGEAALAFKEPTQDLSFLGEGYIPSQAPQQRAVINAPLVTRSVVAERVREDLGVSAPVEALQDSVNARAEAASSLVIIQARSSDPEFAARLANQFAKHAAEFHTEEERERLAEAEESVRRDFRAQERSGDVLPITAAQYRDRLSRLQLLQDFGTPVEVTRRSEVPDAPIAPDTVMNTGIGILIGLALGLLVAFIRDSLDVRLRGAKEIQAQVKLPLLGHVGRDAMGSAGAVSHNGHGKLSQADLETFRILRKNLEFLDIDRRLKVVAVTSPLPEEGKSTVAASLAGAYAQGGKRTLLVECDLRRPALADRLGLKRSPGLTDYLTEQVGPQEVLQGVALPALVGSKNGHGNGNGAQADANDELVCIMAGSTVPRPGDILASKRFKDFVKQVSEAYDVVVLDTSPLLSVSDTLEVLPLVDGVILCVRAGQTRRDEARAAKAALEHLSEQPAGLVVTGIRPGDETDYGYYSSTYAYGPTETGSA